MELTPALATELLPGTLSLDAITVLDQRAGALEALARRHELDRASLHGHLVTALRAGALDGEATLSAMFEKFAPAIGRLSAHEAPRGRGVVLHIEAPWPARSRDLAIARPARPWSKGCG